MLDPGKSTLLGTVEAARLFAAGQWDAARAVLNQVRVTQFYLLIPGTGLLGFGMYFLPLALFDRSMRPVALAILCTLIFWVLVLFQPHQTAIHIGSMFPEVALIVLVLAFLSKRSAAAALSCAAGQVALTVFQYAF